MSTLVGKKRTKTKTATPLWTGAEWTPQLLEKVYAACEDIARNELKLSVYPNQIEIITSEQMLDAYAANGMPIFYNHWSFGKRFTRQSEMYKAGAMGLAYEIVINSSPCINYLMEENSMTMQALVIAHAAFGHNHFFKNNYLFREWTDAAGIVDYLMFARNYIARCEEQEGRDVVEEFIDACHALQDYGVDLTRRPPKLSVAKERDRQREREAHAASRVNELDRIVFAKESVSATDDDDDEKPWPGEPQSNLLYFFEKYSPDLKPWQREIIRITRKMSQYFYPQIMTKVGNEGFASWTHYKIITRLHEKGLMTDGAMLEFLGSHTNVLFQPAFGDPRYGGLNPYSLGFNILRDIERAAVDPDDEDRKWLSSIAGRGDPIEVVKEAAENYRDESLIRQFLSPKVIRHMRLFHIMDPGQNSRHLVVDSIHQDQGYQKIRDALADTYEWHAGHPKIEVLNVNRRSHRLTLGYTPYKGRDLDQEELEQMIWMVKLLWPRPVLMQNTETGNYIYD